MRQPIVIANHQILPGQSASIALPVAKLYTHSELTMPVQVIHSLKKGPVLFVTAAIHGDEINGVEIIRRLLKILNPKKIQGTLVTVPVVNTHGFLSKSRYLPDRRDLNRSFPGSAKGNMASRVAHLFLKEIVSKCSHGNDLHTAAIHRNNLPQIRACLEDKKTKAMALAFRAPVVLNSNLRDGSLRQAVLERKIPILLYEGGEALRFNEIAIRAGVNGVLSVMQHLGMIAKKINIKESKPYIAKTSRWIRAPESGLFRSRKKLGAKINQGDTLGYIADPFGKNEVKVSAPIDGIVIGKSQIPLVDQGEALYHLASFKKTAAVEEEVSDFQAELGQEPVYLNANV